MPELVRCPNGHIGRVDEDQLNGDVSILCGSCEFHGFIEDCEVLD